MAKLARELRQGALVELLGEIDGPYELRRWGLEASAEEIGFQRRWRRIQRHEDYWKAELERPLMAIWERVCAVDPSVAVQMPLLQDAEYLVRDLRRRLREKLTPEGREYPTDYRGGSWDEYDGSMKLRDQFEWLRHHVARRLLRGERELLEELRLAEVTLRHAAAREQIETWDDRAVGAMDGVELCYVLRERLWRPWWDRKVRTALADQLEAWAVSDVRVWDQRVERVMRLLWRRVQVDLPDEAGQWARMLRDASGWMRGLEDELEARAADGDLVGPGGRDNYVRKLAELEARLMEAGSISGAGDPALVEAQDRLTKTAVPAADGVPGDPPAAAKQSIRPCDQEAWGQYRMACVELLDLADGQEPTDREAYEALMKHYKRRGSNPLPGFATWSKYVRAARRAYGLSKHKRRLSPGSGSGSVRHAGELDASDLRSMRAGAD